MFVLLKLLLFFFRPLTWILLLGLFALLTRNPRRKRLAFRATVLALLFFTNPFVIRSLLAAYEMDPVTLQPNQRFNTGILLGGMVAYNPTDNQGYFNSAADRFVQTALLYKRGQIENILIAAGNGYATKGGFTEAGFIRQRLMELGIPASNILVDGASRNTLENAQNAKRVADSAHLTGPCLLISSALHLPRAEKLFRKTGLPVVLYPCDFLTRDQTSLLEDYVLPSSVALQRWDSLLKEWVGTLAYYLTGKT